MNIKNINRTIGKGNWLQMERTWTGWGKDTSNTTNVGRSHPVMADKSHQKSLIMLVSYVTSLPLHAFSQKRKMHNDGVLQSIRPPAEILLDHFKTPFPNIAQKQD